MLGVGTSVKSPSSSLADTSRNRTTVPFCDWEGCRLGLILDFWMRAGYGKGTYVMDKFGNMVDRVRVELGGQLHDPFRTFLQIAVYKERTGLCINARSRRSEHFYRLLCTRKELVFASTQDQGGPAEISAVVIISQHDIIVQHGITDRAGDFSQHDMVSQTRPATSVIVSQHSMYQPNPEQVPTWTEESLLPLPAPLLLLPECACLQVSACASYPRLWMQPDVQDVVQMSAQTVEWHTSFCTKIHLICENLCN